MKVKVCGEAEVVQGQKLGHGQAENANELLPVEQKREEIAMMKSTQRWISRFLVRKETVPLIWS